MITADLVVDETKRDTKGRRITPKARRQELLAAYEQSGLTQAAFARREGVKYQTFAAWVSEWRRRSAAVGPSKSKSPKGSGLQYSNFEFSGFSPGEVLADRIGRPHV